jgi:hypothetical protein
MVRLFLPVFCHDMFCNTIPTPMNYSTIVTLIVSGLGGPMSTVSILGHLGYTKITFAIPPEFFNYLIFFNV